jgi:flavorubredoxin
MPEIELEADSRVEDNDLLHIGDLEFKVILTPGHTCGSSCLYCKDENLLFSGDTIFKGAWGRTDLPTSSMNQIMESITNVVEGAVNITDKVVNSITSALTLSDSATDSPINKSNILILDNNLRKQEKITVNKDTIIVLVHYNK